MPILTKDAKRRGRLYAIIFCSILTALCTQHIQGQCVSTTANGFQENLLQATFHSALYKTSDGYAASGSSTAPDGSAQPNIQVISNANGYTGIPASTTIVWGSIGGNAQIVLLGDDGVIYAGGVEGVVLDPSLTSSPAYGPTSLGLPAGIGIGDIHKFQATNEVLMIHTNSGEIYVTGDMCGNVISPSVTTSWNQVSMPSGVTAEIADISAKTLFIYGSDGIFYTRGKRIFKGNGDPSIDNTAAWTTMTSPTLSAGSSPVQIELGNHEHYNQIAYLILDADGSVHSLGNAPIVANNSAFSFSWTKVGQNCPDGELQNVVYLTASDNDNRHVGAGAVLADSTIMLWGVDDFNMLAGAGYECPSEVCSEPGSDMSHIVYLENGTHLTPAITESGLLCNVGHNSEGGFGDGTTNNRSCYECYSVPSLPELCIDGSCFQDTTVVVSICDGETYYEQGSAYTEAGAYIDIYQSSGGCDSIVTTQLSILPSNGVTNEVTICDGESYFEQSSEYTSTGTYTDIYPSNGACDSVVTTILTVLTQLTTTNDVVICEGQSYFEGSSEYSLSGTYQDSYVTSIGCDSLVTTILTVQAAISTTNEVAICQGESYIEGTSEYSVSGTYQDYYVSSGGCDSLVTTVLNVSEAFTTTNEVMICEGQSYFEGSSEYSTSGIYQDIYQSVNGCDSVVTTELEVITEFNSVNEVTICAGESYLEQTSVYTESGTYEDIYISAGGCDSLVTTELIVLPPSSQANSVSICAGESYQVQGNLYSENGIYTHIYESSFGCDSIVITDLTVIPMPIVDLGMDDLISCDPLEITFQNQIESNGDLQYNWSMGNGVISTEQTLTHFFDWAGIYNISLSLSNNQCQSMDVEPVTIEIFEQPTASFTASNWTANLNAPEIQFYDESIGSIVTHEWDFGDGSAGEGTIVSNSYITAGEYVVTLAITSDAGCTDTVSNTVLIETYEDGIVIPNAFIPDPSGPSDGVYNIHSPYNQIFFPYSEDAVAMKFYVFNRWGEQIFMSNEIEKGWDGYFQGKLCPLSVYSYRVIFSYPDGEEIEKMGTVTLFR